MSELDIGHAAVGLQVAQDPKIDLVELDVAHANSVGRLLAASSVKLYYPIYADKALHAAGEVASRCLRCDHRLAITAPR
jgi:hypothetical protein